MSTRGSVGIYNGTDKKGNILWTGVYNHYDSYPDGLGEDVYLHLQKMLNEKGNLLEFKSILNSTTWEAYLRKNQCPYCGQITGSPNSIQANLMDVDTNVTMEERILHYEAFPAWNNDHVRIMKAVTDEFEIINNVKNTGFPDPKALYHSHDELTDDRCSNIDTDPLFIEWVYVVDIDNHIMNILKSVSDGVKHRRKKEEEIKAFEEGWKSDGYYHYNDCAYKHMKVYETVIDATHVPSFDEVANTVSCIRETLGI